MSVESQYITNNDCSPRRAIWALIKSIDFAHNIEA